MAIQKRDGKGGGATHPSLAIKPKPKLQTSAKRKFVMPAQLVDISNKMNVKYGEGTIHRASSAALDYGRLSTGILVLDLCLGGGFKLSRTSMLYGEKSAGKSTTALVMVARMQKMFPDEVVVWIDIEGTIDRVWAQTLGVDLERLFIVQPETGEDAIDMALGMIATDSVSMVVTDSVAALTPMKEVESSAEDVLVGAQARLIGSYLRKLQVALLMARKNKRYPLNLLLNQFRMKIGVMFGDPRVLPGGKALEFAASQCVLMSNKVHKSEKGDDAGHVKFNEHIFQITKDKTGGGRMTEGKFKLIRDESEGYPPGYIDQSKTVLHFAAKLGMFTGAGANQHLEGCGTFRTQADIGQFFYENPDKLEAINRKIIDFYQKKWGMI